MSKTREAQSALNEFDRYFTSMNCVDVDARISVPRDEWRVLRGKIEAALSEPEQEPVVWLPMDSAPKEGTSVRLLVEGEAHPMQDASPSITIGAYGVHGGPDEDPTWDFAGWSWSHDCYVRGTGTPIGWLPLLGSGPSLQPLKAEPTTFQSQATYPSKIVFSPFDVTTTVQQPREWQELSDENSEVLCAEVSKALSKDNPSSYRKYLVARIRTALRAKNGG